MNEMIEARFRVVVSHRDPVVHLGLTAALMQSPVQGDVFACSPKDERLPALVERAAVLVTDYAQGLEHCARMHQDAGPAATGVDATPVKVMVVSDRDGEQEIRRAIDAGVKGYLLSGFELEEFLEGIRSLSQGTRYLCSVAAHRMVDSLSRESLTEREMQVLRCLVDGYVNKRIGNELGIALGTVKAHVKSIFSKFGVATRTQAVCVATRRGILSPKTSPNSDRIRKQDLRPEGRPSFF